MFSKTGNLPAIREYPKGEVVLIKSSALPFEKMSEGQMGVLSIPQQILARFITKNPKLKNLIDSFDLDISL